MVAVPLPSLADRPPRPYAAEWREALRQWTREKDVPAAAPLAVALTGRSTLVRDRAPAVRLNMSRSGRAGATSYLTAPNPAGLTLGRPDRF